MRHPITLVVRSMNRFKQEPRWAAWSQLRHLQMPAGMATWLRDRDSLTARLKGVTQGDFRVRLLRQSWGRPLASEQQLLGMRRGEIAIVREVELICCGVPWVFARTLIPARSLSGAARRLTLLGERPLGEVLFADPQAQRGVTQMAVLDRRHPLYVAAMGGEVPARRIWGRRSLFHLSGQPLLVNELFLPELPLR